MGGRPQGLIDALGVEKPIVLGLSFGGLVAQNYAIRHPDRLHKLILASTVARMLPQRVFDAFERFGGEKARDVAIDFWGGPNQENTANYLKSAFPCIPVSKETKRLNKERYGRLR